MRRSLLVALTATSLMVVPAVSSAATASDTKIGNARVCATAKTGFAACHAHVRTKGAKPDATVNYTSGFNPAQLRKAYGIGSGSAPLVAVVDAYASPKAASDLAAYRTQFNLGPANLTQVNQTGGSITTVAGDVGWGQEEMLDLEMVSAICPACPILYVGGNSASFNDL